MNDDDIKDVIIAISFLFLTLLLLDATTYEGHREARHDEVINTSNSLQ